MERELYKEECDLLRKYVGGIGVRNHNVHACAQCCASSGGGKVRYQDKNEKIKK